jgi:hypothetical protein
MNKRIALAITAIVAFSSLAMATTIAVGNGSFEANGVAPGGQFGAGSTVPASGWQTVWNSDGQNTVGTYAWRRQVKAVA